MHAATVLSPGTKSMLQKLMVLDVANLTRAAVEAAGREGRWRGVWSRRQQNDVSSGRNAATTDLAS